jgi:SAM-dependent methyltransferase
MISATLISLAQCPDCGVRLLQKTAGLLACPSCGREFSATGDYLDLRPRSAFSEQTKYLDHELHADARHETIAPPVLGSKIRNDMLRRFLKPGPNDRIVDLGCGSGRAIAWNASSGASIVGVDISPFFAAEAVAGANLVLGDLRRVPLVSNSFNKAWSLDVMEHLSPEALRDVLSEAHRVLEPGGSLFIYTHVRKNGWPAAGVRFVNRLAKAIESAGLIDLRQERLRKSDHLNPIADHDEWIRVSGECGFTVERIAYYSPIIGAFMENVVARMVERVLARRAAKKAGPASPSADADAAIKAARKSAQARVRQRGPTYWALRGATALMKIDVALFGRVRSGPFFTLLRRQDDRRGAA